MLLHILEYRQSQKKHYIFILRSWKSDAMWQLLKLCMFVFTQTAAHYKVLKLYKVTWQAEHGHRGCDELMFGLELAQMQGTYTSCSKYKHFQKVVKDFGGKT